MHINIFTTLLGIIENIGGAVGEGLMGYGEGGDFEGLLCSPAGPVNYNSRLISACNICLSVLQRKQFHSLTCHTTILSVYDTLTYSTMLALILSNW